MDIPEQWMEEQEEGPVWNPQLDRVTFHRDPVRRMRDHDHPINDREPLVLCSLAMPRDEALLVAAFEQLISKMDSCVDQFYDNNRRYQVSSDFSSHSHQIEKILLPSLQDQIFRVCDILFGPAHFEQNESSKFQAGLKALQEVEEVVDQIFTSMTSFWLPRDAVDPTPTKFRDVPSYRGEFTRTKMLDLMERLAGLFEIYGAVLHLSIRVSDMHVGHHAWRKLINDTHIMRDYVDDVIKWLGLSDLGVIQDEWGMIAQDADHLIQNVAEFPVFNSYKRLSQDFMSLVKVSRLFYSKMAKANKTEYHPISQMPTIQLAQFLHGTLSSGVPEALLNTIEFPNHNDDDLDVGPSSNLTDWFGGPVKILNEYLDHRASSPTSPPDPLHREFCDWYITWKEQFSLAVNRFLASYKEAHVALRNDVQLHHA